MSIDLSLDRLRLLISHLPPYTCPTIHVAGTNGKGSVSSLLSTILLSSTPPLSIGRYNSPHLVSIYDSITLNNNPVDPSIYAVARTKIESADKEHNTSLSNFELLTLTALLIFTEAKVDIAVVEVGLGGRLDATNIIPTEAIAVSVLTAVDLDHQAFLGSTVSAIAREKAGIARPGKPFILGPQNHPEVESVVKDVVKQAGGEVVVGLVRVVPREWDENIDGSRPPQFSFTAVPFKEPPPQPVAIYAPSFPDPIRTLLPLYGKHQLDNLSTVVAAISSLLTQPSGQQLNLANRITPETISHGIKTTHWAGRLSFHTIPVPIGTRKSSDSLRSRPLVVLADGAHNPAASVTLSAYITDLLFLATAPTPQAHITTPHTINLNLSYILALSHSPPKTPIQTLKPLLSAALSLFPDTKLKVKVKVACVRFTPPEGMPWVKPVPPVEISEVVKGLLLEGSDWKVWVAEEERLTGEVKGKGELGQLERALEWVVKDEDGKNGEGGGETKGPDLVVVAGSLYLVADFYRLLESVEEGREDPRS